ncbi:MAG: sigma-54 dependent transcriptional regulator [Pseudomonadota bacterium]
MPKTDPHKAFSPADDLRILFVDDEPEILLIVEAFLRRQGFSVTVADSGEKALDILAAGHFDILFTDLQMPGVSGLEVLKRAKEISPQTEVVILTGYGTIDSAVEALKHGSYDYIQKPIAFERLKHLIDRIAEATALRKENVLYKQRLDERFGFGGLVGASPGIRAIYQIVDRIRHSTPTVLIQGESGTGKELVANVIHQNSSRKTKAFIPVNCGAIVGNLLESELFGHVKGAFTGAIRDHDGLFRAADGGTIFLDEVSEIDPALQVKLLRVIQEKTIRAVGATQEHLVDVRIIAATNRSSEELLHSGIIREDLYYRLNVVTIQMPPLRAMPGDIPLLVDHFIDRFNNRFNRTIRGISQEAMDALQRYRWPGNVRQLENAVERAFALGIDDIIDAGDLPAELLAGADPSLHNEGSLNMQENEIRLIRRALERTGGNRAKSADLLGVNTATVYRKIQRYGL